MTRHLVLIHGRAQQHKDATALKSEWLDALRHGLDKNGLSLPVPDSRVHFPYYGDTLIEMVKGRSPDEAAEVILRGLEGDQAEQDFVRDVLAEIRDETGVTDAEIDASGRALVIERGVLNWEWVQAFVRIIDRNVPYGSGTAIATFTRDVYQYLNNRVIRGTIDDGVSRAIPAGEETVVVSHSLGTVVAYNVLQRGASNGWRVPMFVTLGSPLAISRIKQAIKTVSGPCRVPACARSWFNAMDEGDVVALYPLDTKHFPINPATPSIVNKQDVANFTDNHHGISGYLSDPVVAKVIHDALTQP